MRPTVHTTRHTPLWLGLLATVLASACGSGSARVEPGLRVDIPAEGQRPEPGPIEARALAYLVEMTAILAEPTERPRTTVQTLAVYLENNGDAIRTTVLELEARIADMTDPERIYYEERFGTYFTPANRAFAEAMSNFRQAHPRAATRIDGMLIYFD